MTTPAKPDYLRLSCVVQTYAWGKVGLHSEVARLKSSAEPESFIVDENEPYAEVGEALCFSHHRWSLMLANINIT